MRETERDEREREREGAERKLKGSGERGIERGGEKERIAEMVADKYRMPDGQNIDNDYQNILKQLKELGVDVDGNDEQEED